MLTNTCKTAIKAVIYLASQTLNGRKKSMKEISDQINASEHTVGKILQTLVRQDVINSMKGPSGGFYMDEDQIEIPIINVVKAIDGYQRFEECGLGLKQCSEHHPCPIHDQYTEARQKIEVIFTESRISDLCQLVNNGVTYLAG